LTVVGPAGILESSVADPPDYRRGSQPYLPPPPETRDDSPESVDVPRMEPPPASLEAMVRSGPGSAAGRERERDSTWLWVSMLLAVGAVITVYVLRSSH
jgi:hypothetical protein